MKNPLRTGKLLLLVAVLVASCYPGDDLVVEELDIVATNYDPPYFALNNPMTYHMPDTVGIIGDGNIGDTDLTREEMELILDQVEANFETLGYERLDRITEDNLPDVVVTVNALSNTTTGAGCIPWYPWWGWYPWFPGWGWGPGYCYPSYVYSYTTGTLTIDMIVADADDEEDFELVWRAGINGLLRSSDAGNEAFVRDNIDQAFDQSPYLQR